MRKPPVPLAVLLSRDVPYEWHDAVALVSQLVAQAEAIGMARLPEFGLLALEENGTLSAAAPEPSLPIMPGAALILQELLSGKPQPAPLRLSTMQAAAPDSMPSLESFMSDLSKFERPARSAQLTQLYTRAFDLIGPDALIEAAQDLAQRPLTVKTAGIQPPATSALKAKKQSATHNTTAHQTASTVALVVIVAAAAAGGYAWYTTHGTALPSWIARRTETPAPSAPSPTVPSEPPAPKRAAAASRAGRSAPIVAAETQLATARDLFNRQEYAVATPGFERVVEMLGTESSPQAEEIRKVASSLAEVSRAAAAAEAEAASQVYRRGDPGVTDPVPLSYLPPKPAPETPADRLEVLEVSIAPDGRVDSAKFVINRPSFRNSWWTSAAKAWKFQPAMKDGRPVRYTMRIVMDDAGGR